MKTRFDDLVSTRKAKAETKPAEKKRATRARPALEKTEGPAPIVAEGKQTGKRSDSGYTQVSAYVKKSTHRDVKAALVIGEEDRDFGELVNDLLEQWIEDLSDDIRQALPSQRRK